MLSNEGVVKSWRIIYNGAMNNYAFVDGQNLNLGTKMSENPWKVDLFRFYKYLQKKYSVIKAYYFIGYMNEKLQALYDDIVEAGFELVFRAHDGYSISRKKGNVDTDVVFTMMRDFHEHIKDMGKIYLISGDGDYFKTIKYLHDKGKLGKVLFPARKKASHLYHIIGDGYYDYLDNPDIKPKIAFQG